jgi:hypothetical protein
MINMGCMLLKSLDKGIHLQIVIIAAIVVLVPRATFGFPSVVALDELRKVARLLCEPYKLMFEKVLGRGSLDVRQMVRDREIQPDHYIFGVALKAQRHEFAKRPRERAIQCWG